MEFFPEEVWREPQPVVSVIGEVIWDVTIHMRCVVVVVGSMVMEELCIEELLSLVVVVIIMLIVMVLPLDANDSVVVRIMIMME